MGKKLTHDEYIARLSKINPNIEVLDEYAGIHTKILHRCKLDKYEWYVCPDSILHGHGCPVCYGNDKKHMMNILKTCLKLIQI